MVAFERWLLTRKFWYFGKLVAEERRSQPEVQLRAQSFFLAFGALVRPGVNFLDALSEF